MFLFIIAIYVPFYHTQYLSVSFGIEYASQPNEYVRIEGTRMSPINV